MSERVILAVKSTPAGAGSQVRKAVGGFLRYVQHRDLHPTQLEDRARPQVSGLLKYVAYRDQASARAELFGPSGTLTSDDRKAFAAFVADALEQSSPQLYRGRDGALRDRRRAVYRLVISPERAAGLDLRRLTSAAVSRFERESGISELRWIAATHRNTAHHHVHLVIAGMHQDVHGYRRIDITKQRLAAMKEELALEIQRQRGERTLIALPRFASAVTGGNDLLPALESKVARSRPIRIPPVAVLASHGARRHRGARSAPIHFETVLRLRAAAQRYRRQVEREAAAEAAERGWEHAA